MYRSKNYYYILKKFIPRSLQISIRRMMLQRKAFLYKSIWPIDQNAKTSPENWQGWPEGKKFALVLTHDVENVRGLNRCREVMKIEEELGFRSSFNFVPGDYIVPQELIDELVKRGFEVGVHGLYHQGNPFRSKTVFSKQVPEINKFLKKWNAVGFRSPSMYHNLEWIHDLNVEYDSSTFDTDPFEPQPDGVGTIFPFWVPDNSNQHGKPLKNDQFCSSSRKVKISTTGIHEVFRGLKFEPDEEIGEKGSLCNGLKGYVELPYTLPQDFLLYILMQEKTIDIWKNKLDWVAEHGGMALFITHPDYMNFNRTKLKEDEFPAEYYKEFLTYIKTQFEGQYWHVLPKDMARFWANKDNSHGSLNDMNYYLQPLSQTNEYQSSKIEPCILSLKPNSSYYKPKHICMLAYSFYESDNRIMRYANALAQRGDVVDVIALRYENAKNYQKIKNVNVYRIQKRIIDEKSKISYLRKLLAFLLRSSIFITRKHFQYPYDIIHVHSVPDFEVFAAILPKFKGTKIILDIHDIVPEFYASKFSGDKDSFYFKTLVKAEQFSIKFSDHVIISNHLWYKTLTSRSVSKSKCTTMMNYPDEDIFYKRRKTRNDDKFIMIYPGTLGWHQGLDTAIKAFGKIKDQAPKAEFHIYGRGTETDELVKLTATLNLGGKVFIKDPMPIDNIAEVMANADIGIVPKRNDSFGGEAFSTKILEFMSLGVPVIVSKTKIDNYYFNDSVVKFFEPNNIDDLAQCMLTLINDESQRQKLANNALQFVENYKWSTKKEEYFNLIDSLVENKSSSSKV